MVKFPGSLHRGRKVTPFVGQADITPTILDVFGLAGDAARLDGKSLLPLLEGKETGPRLCPSIVPDYVFAAVSPLRVSLIRGRYKFIYNERFPDEAMTFYSPPPAQPPPVELFDLRLDPEERRNLADEMPHIARPMFQEVQKFLEAVKSAARPTDAVLDKELEESLRALGYIR